MLASPPSAREPQPRRRGPGCRSTGHAQNRSRSTCGCRSQLHRGDGVSGSGKSTLCVEVLLPCRARGARHGQRAPARGVQEVRGAEPWRRARARRTGADRPPSALGSSDLRRNLGRAAQAARCNDEARVRGYDAGRSLQRRRGPLSNCEGTGVLTVEMSFRGCCFLRRLRGGKRFARETLDGNGVRAVGGRALELEVESARSTCSRRSPRLRVREDARGARLGYLKPEPSAR